jgi:hypothetical protein
MTLKAVHVGGERRRLTLSERIVDENLGSYRQVAQSRERLRCAAASVEAHPPRPRTTAPHEDEAWDAQLRDPLAPRERDPALGVAPDTHAPPGQDDDREAELADVAWLREWAHAAVRARRRAPVSGKQQTAEH